MLRTRRIKMLITNAYPRNIVSQIVFTNISTKTLNYDRANNFIRQRIPNNLLITRTRKKTNECRYENVVRSIFGVSIPITGKQVSTRRKNKKFLTVNAYSFG